MYAIRSYYVYVLAKRITIRIRTTERLYKRENAMKINAFLHYTAGIASLFLLAIFGWRISFSHADQMQRIQAEQNPIVITSYSIHYTKLYDSPFASFKKQSVARALNKQRNTPHRFFRRFRWSHSPTAATWTAPAVGLLSPSHSCRRRCVITSYSIHYTKLYDKNLWCPSTIYLK